MNTISAKHADMLPQQKLKLAAKPTSQRESAALRHTVQAGETVSQLSARYLVSAASIQNANPTLVQNPRLPLTPGDELHVHRQPADRLQPYVLTSGDSVDALMARYKLDPANLALDNGWAEAPPLLFAGDTLLLPANVDTQSLNFFVAEGELDFGNPDQESLFTLTENFETFDGAGDNGHTDGVVAQNDLEYIREHPDEFGGEDSQVYKAAVYYLENPSAWDALDQAAGVGGDDNRVGAKDVLTAMEGHPPPSDMTSEQAQAYTQAYARLMDSAIASGQMQPNEAQAHLERFAQICAEAAVGNEHLAQAMMLGMLEGHAYLPPEIILGAWNSLISHAGLDPTQVDRILTALQPQIKQLLEAIGITYSLNGEQQQFDSMNAGRFSDALDALFGLSLSAGAQGNSVLADVIAQTYPGALEDPPGGMLGMVAFRYAIGEPKPYGLLNALAPALEGAGLQNVLPLFNHQIQEGLLLGVSSNIEHYIEVTEQYNYAMQMRPLFASDAEFEAALDELMIDTLGADWRSQVDQATQALAQQGEEILSAVSQMSDNPEVCMALLNDPQAQFAVSMALASNPALTQGEAGEALLQTLADLGISGMPGPNGEPAHPLAPMVAEAYLRNNVLLPLGDQSLSTQQRTQIIDQALGNNPALAQMLGTDTAHLQAFVAGLSELPIPNPGEPPSQEFLDGFTSLIGTLGEFNNPQTQGFLKLVGLVFAIPSVVGSAGDVLSDPSLSDAVAFLIDTAGLGVTGAEFLNIIGRAPNYSFVSAASKVLTLIGAGIAALNSLDRFGQGDFIGGGLSAVLATGLAIGGPWGFGVAAIAQVVLLGYDAWRMAEYNNRFETDAQRDFLARSLLGPELAEVLFDTSGNAVSPLPMLLNYCQESGLTLEQSIAYLHYLNEQKLLMGGTALSELRDSIHRVLDENGGDATDFTTAQLDAMIQPLIPLGNDVMMPTEWLESQGG